MQAVKSSVVEVMDSAKLPFDFLRELMNQYPGTVSVLRVNSSLRDSLERRSRLLERVRIVHCTNSTQPIDFPPYISIHDPYGTKQQILHQHIINFTIYFLPQ